MAKRNSETDKGGASPSEQVSNHIAALGGWRGKTMARLRKLVLDASPNVTEEWKWDTPVYAHNGNVLALGAFKDAIKINFFKGASLDDPDRLFNAGLDAKGSRAIDLREGDPINESALRHLVRAGVAQNSGGGESNK